MLDEHDGAGFVRWMIAGELTVILHLAVFHALDHVSDPRPPGAHPPIEVTLVAPPRPPPPPPPPVIEPPPPPVEHVHERRPTRQRAARIADTPVDTPVPLDRPTVVSATTTTPVYGAVMTGTSSGGVAVKVGNTSDPSAAGSAQGPADPLVAPVSALDVSTMPVPRGRCTGRYTEAARAASLEGVVILDLVVDATGRARDITVVRALGHGLTETAIAALRDCRFTPGTKDGNPVAVRVRGFKIRFLLDD